jgi:hypothetical protein
MDDSDVLAAERLRDRLTELRSELRETYATAARPVGSQKLRVKTADAAEQWLVRVEPQLRTARGIKPDHLADRSIAFQRLLSLSERESRRGLYEKEIARILDDYRAEVVFPAKVALQPGARPLREEPRFVATAFVGHSFAEREREVVSSVVQALASVGIHTETGERPAADKISVKVKRRIEAQHMFVGVFTRGDRLGRRQRWTTSAWVIDEKAYAHARGKRLILLRENGVDSIGGIQGDQEYIPFDRARLDKLALAVIALFDVSVKNLRS